MFTPPYLNLEIRTTTAFLRFFSFSLFFKITDYPWHWCIFLPANFLHVQVCTSGDNWGAFSSVGHTCPPSRPPSVLNIYWGKSFRKPKFSWQLLQINLRFFSKEKKWNTVILDARNQWSNSKSTLYKLWSFTMDWLHRTF